MKISIASDHGGFDLKQSLIEYLNVTGYEVIDQGCYDKESVDYPNYAKLVCNDVINNNCEYGILVCTTGIGMSICANKYHGIRAALVTNEEVSKLCREHNNSNVLCLGAKYTPASKACEYVHNFINTPFAGGRHERRVELIEPKEK